MCVCVHALHTHAYTDTHVYKQIIKTLQDQRYRKDVNEVLRETSEKGLTLPTRR